MTKIGDIVFVQTKGICEVKNITKNAFDGCDKTKEYYVLKPIDSPNNMMVYFPTDTKIQIRSLSSKSDAEKLLKNFASLSEIVVDSEETRFSNYDSVLKSGSLENWCRLLKTLLIRKSQVQKKQFNVQEQKHINTLLSCVLAEFSYVLGKTKEEINEAIFSCVV